MTLKILFYIKLLWNYYKKRKENSYITQKRSPASTLSYSYDTNGQLVSANKSENPSDNESFSYDALGNRLTYNGVASTYDTSSQRIQDDGQFIYVFDANGNIIYKQNKSNGISYTFEYSALNQLKKATVTSTPLNGNVLKSIEYKYDPVGRRISRQVTDFENSSKSKTQKFYYDGDNIIAELDESNSLTASYTHSPLRSDDILGAKFTSYAVSNNLVASAGYVYYLKDHLNTVNEITNAVGDIVQKIVYSAFGIIRSVKDSTGAEVGFAAAPVRSSFTYTGRECEPELGMYYYRARYYDPSVGRFLQQDPDPGKRQNPITFINKYVYSGNNPVIYSDPSGMAFGWDDFLYLVAYTAAISATQAHYQTNNGGDPNYHKNFWNNFWINLTFTAAGIGWASYKGAKTFEIGWGGIYSTDKLTGIDWGYSLGYFQSVPGSEGGSAFYWHEVGHSINFFLGTLANDYSRSSLLEQYQGSLTYFALTLPGTGPLEHKYNPFTWIGEGSTTLWGRIISGEWHGFPH